METFYIRRSLNGKSFAASADPAFQGLAGRKCPFFGEDFEPQVKEVNSANAEIMGVNFDEVAAGLNKEALYFGKFKINLGETMII
ncbi:MAG: hypothetical protein AB1641_29775 [Thermodesulfobacteriota bacterium]